VLLCYVNPLPLLSMCCRTSVVNLIRYYRVTQSSTLFCLSQRAARGTYHISPWRCCCQDNRAECCTEYNGRHGDKHRNFRHVPLFDQQWIHQWSDCVTVAAAFAELMSFFFVVGGFICVLGYLQALYGGRHYQCDGDSVL